MIIFNQGKNKGHFKAGKPTRIVDFQWDNLDSYFKMDMINATVAV